MSAMRRASKSACFLLQNVLSYMKVQSLCYSVPMAGASAWLRRGIITTTTQQHKVFCLECFSFRVCLGVVKPEKP